MVDLTVGKLPKAVAATIIGDSLISEAAGAISVASLLHVYGDVTLHGATSGTLAMRAPTIAGTSVITWPVGTTNFTTTGGTGRVLRQSTVGGAITVGTIATTDVTGLAPIASSGSASDLTAGIVPSARVSGAYTGITSVGTLGAGIWNASTIGLAYGGTQANLSATGGTSQFLRQQTAGGAITVTPILTSDVFGLAPIASSGSASDLTAGIVPSARIAGAYTGITSVGTITAGVWNGTAVGLAYGGTGANLSATGGTGQVLKQLTTGGAITVAALTPTDVGVAGAYLPLSGGALTGNLSITTAGNTNLALGSPAGLQAYTAHFTASTLRWVLGKTNEAEGGSNAGSNFGLQRFNDAGTFQSYALLSERATGRLGINFGVGVLPQALLHVGASNATARTYQSFTDAANGTWAYLGDWSKTSTVATFGTDQLGTGTAWPVAIMAGGVEAMRITTLGEIGIGTSSPLGRVNVAGTYTTANATLFYVASTLASSFTSTQNAFLLSTTFAPTSASALVGAQIVPTLNSTALALTATYAIYCDFTFGASFTGTVTNVYGVAVADITGSVPGQLGNLRQYSALGLSNGNGLTTGTVLNSQFLAGGITAGAAGGAVSNRGVYLNMPSGGASAGSVSNIGLYITGNGGTASGGTVTNYAIFSDSTAPMQIGGTFQFLGSTASFPMLKRSGTSIQVRLADDSGFGALDTTTLTGVTTLPGSGQISATGDLGLGTAPGARLHVGGTYSAAVANYVWFAGTYSSSSIAPQTVLNVAPTITPTGASVGAITGLSVAPSLDNTALAVGNYFGITATPQLGAGYSGTATSIVNFSAVAPTINAAVVSNVFQYLAAALATNDGAATGTKNNTQFNAQGITSGSAGGTINNRGVQVTMPSGGASAGTTTNRGIYITGNGGTASGSGTVNNFALFSDSTAPMQIGGTLQFLGSTASFPMLKRSATIIQARLADDTNFAPIQGQLRTHTNYTAGAPPAATGYLTLYDAAGTAYRVACVV